MITLTINWLDAEGNQQVLTFDAPAELQPLLRSLLLYGVGMTGYNKDGLLNYAEWYQGRSRKRTMSVIDLAVTPHGDDAIGPDIDVLGVRERGRIEKP